MRLFIAFHFLSDYFSELQKALPDAKLTLPKSFHLTLKFLGDVDESKLDIIKTKLQTIKFKPITTKLSHIDTFPNDRHIKVIWIALNPDEQITELQKQIDTALEDIFPKEQNFKPHLTIARVKHIQHKTEFKQKLKQIRVENLEFNLDSFELIQSTLTPEGPLYKTIEKFS